MLVEHLLEAGGSGGIVPWYNIRKDLFLDKVRTNAIVSRASARVLMPFRCLGSFSLPGVPRVRFRMARVSALSVGCIATALSPL